MGGSGPTPHTTESTTTSHAATPAGKLSKDVATNLAAAQKLANAGDMQGAMASIKAAQAVPDRTSHDDFVINQFLSAVAANLRDYKTAAAAYDVMLNSPDFADQPDADKKLAYHDGIIVNGNVQGWQKVITMGGQLDALQGNDEITYTEVAIAYYNLKDTKNALVYAQKAQDYAKANNKPVPEQTQELIGQAAAQSNPALALQQAELQAVDHNEPDLWYKLALNAVGSTSPKEIDGLALYRLIFMAGGMQSSDDYLIMGQLSGKLGYPTEQSKVLDQGMASGKVSPGQAGGQLGAARKGAAEDERMLGNFAASAAKAKSGDQSVKLAEDYWGYGRYADAEAAARQGIAKGDPKDPSEGLMILGESLVAQGKYDEAVSTFGQVSGNRGRMAAAHLWTLYAQARKKAGMPGAAH
jgi:hypothetical protein